MEGFRLKLPKWKLILYPILLFIIVYISNLYLQGMQNKGSLDLALKFALSWHQSKFLLGTGALLFLSIFIISLLGNFWGGILTYLVIIGFVGIATNLKMLYREEPLYPADFQMLTEVKLLYQMAPKVLIISAFIIVAILLFLISYWFIKSLKKKEFYVLRLFFLLLSFVNLSYAAQFNRPNNLLKKAYDKTALWIPYSQSMNYYNVGFVGGFLYNLGIEAMEKPQDYSEKNVEAITEKYEALAQNNNQALAKKTPNLVLVMSESFSDPTALKGLTFSKDPLEPFRRLQDNNLSGKMLSVGYGGGTANIEFEALTSFSMALFSPQLTTPYTMLVPSFKHFPSVVELLKKLDYQTTAIHPYNTSMYKRQDVYRSFGFDEFLSEKDFSNPKKLAKNPYISDEAAYEKVLEKLKNATKPNFIHLVTMQTHMPYNNKYPETSFNVSPNNDSIKNYSEDIYQASLALEQFLNEVKKLDEETLVLFWGDHLPSIYPEEIMKENGSLKQHETEFLMFNNRKEETETVPLTSPFYFLPQLFARNQLKQSPFYCFLNELQEEMPAFEKGTYLVKGKIQKELPKNEKLEELYKKYQLLQYDVTAGKSYSTKRNFYQVLE